MSRLSLFGIYDNKIAVYDNKTQQIVEVVTKGNSCKCLKCKSDECIHVGYALGVVSKRSALSKG